MLSPEILREKFLEWQCQSRIQAFRTQNGRPNSSMTPVLLDKKGNLISSSSIMLTREDWLRFGMYVIELMKDKNSCEAKKLQEAFKNAVPTKKKFAPKYAMYFWLNGYGVENLVQMRGHGLRLSLIDWKNDKIIQTNGFAISWKPQELVNLIWK